MAEHPVSLTSVYEGWEGYNSSIVQAINPLGADQLAFRAAEGLRSVGEIAAHISVGRVAWFERMGVERAHGLANAMTPDISVSINRDASSLSMRLEASWSMIMETLRAWDVSALTRTYPQEFQGQTYAVSYQWTIWRVMAHDIHHGGELALLLGMQGIPVSELGDLGGHITMPPLADGT